MKAATTPLMARHAAGFTLIELMIALAILAVLLTIATPSFREAVLNARMTAQANDLMADLNLARSEAVKRDMRVYLCTSSNGTTCTAGGWTVGWLVYVDLDGDGVKDANELALKTRPALNTGNNLIAFGDLPAGGGARQIVYRPQGTSNVGGAVVSFVMCDIRFTNNAAINMNAQRAQNKGRLIQINQTGRPVTTRWTCTTATV